MRCPAFCCKDGAGYELGLSGERTNGGLYNTIEKRVGEVEIGRFCTLVFFCFNIAETFLFFGFLSAEYCLDATLRAGVALSAGCRLLGIHKGGSIVYQ